MLLRICNEEMDLFAFNEFAVTLNKQDDTFCSLWLSINGIGKVDQICIAKNSYFVATMDTFVTSPNIKWGSHRRCSIKKV